MKAAPAGEKFEHLLFAQLLSARCRPYRPYRCQISKADYEMTSSRGAQSTLASLNTSARTSPSPTAPASLSPEQSFIAAEPESRKHDAVHGHTCGRGAQQPASTGRRKSSTGVGEPARIRRRNRMITSCLECRRRKLKCDRSHPCSNCAKASRECLFLAPALDPTTRMKLTELKDKMGTLERTLEWDMVDRARAGEEFHPEVDTHKYGSLWDTQDEAYFPVPEDEKNLQPNPLAVLDVGYEDDIDDDETYDLGFKLGKLRITDRLGGFVRPRITDELTAVLSDISFKEEGYSQVVPPPSKPPRLEDISPEEKAIYFSPSSTFTAPRSDIIMGPQRPFSIRDYLPSQVICDMLFRHYMEAVHFAAKVVHRPTFEKQYRDFCGMVVRGTEIPASLQALTFASLFSAAITLSEEDFSLKFGVSQRKMIDNLQLGAELALAKAHVIRTGKMQTLQALVLYLIPMCRTEISRAHSVLVGAAIRLAECLGLHSDPEEFGFDPVETQVRRMVWYQLCYLDLRTSEVQGPRISIQRESFSTKFPLNVDDTELMEPEPPRTDAARWTDMTLSRIRIECQEMHRILYMDRLRIDRKQISLLAVLSNIESFKQAMETKYGPLVDVPNPTSLQRVARLTMSILILRCYIIVLHRYHTSASTPDRLRQLNLVCGAEQLEQAIELETDPSLKPWHWLSSAVNLNHISLLLLADVYIHPMRKEADRLFRSFDYIFEVPPNLRESSIDGTNDISRHDIISRRNAKARHILQQFRDRFSLYLQARKLKVPVKVSGKPLPRPTYDDGEDIDDTNLPSTSLFAKIKEEYTRKPKPTAATRARTVTTSSQPYPPIQSSRPTAVSSHTARPVSFQPPVDAKSQRPDDPSKVGSYFNQQTTATQPPITTQPPISVEMNMLSLSTPSSEVAPSYQTYNSAVQPPARAPYGPPYPTPQSRPQESSGNSSVSSPKHFNSGQGLWFLPGVSQAGAGVASTVPTPGGFAQDMLLGLSNNNPSNGENSRQVPVQNRNDLPMSDIDWVSCTGLLPSASSLLANTYVYEQSEWNKFFPPDVNNGEINLPLLTTETTTSSQYNSDPAVIFGTAAGYSQYNYPYMQPSMQQQQGQS
ncbi:hypothetical protein KEM54_002927 [Ascosphaera aggregata]|nr:hypothetical protein KEM54_002927 [Ascosphaera aggregata]